MNYREKVDPKENCLGSSSTLEARETIANIVMNRFIDDLSVLENIVTDLVNKLDPICRDSYPNDCVSNETKEEKYPPFFNELRSYCYRIEYQISKLNDLKSRLEL